MRALAVGCLLAIGSTSLVSIQASAADQAPPSIEASEAACPDVLILAARGSGEAPATDEEAAYAADIDLGAGLVGATFAREVSAKLSSVGAQRVRWEGVRYPAAPVLTPLVLAGGDYWNAYQASVIAGAGAITARIARLRQATCGSTTKIVLAGYSQGAWAVRRALRALPAEARSQILAAVLFGDPLYQPTESVVRWRKPGKQQTAQGVARTYLTHFDTWDKPFLNDDPTNSDPLKAISSFCIPKDPICQFSATNVVQLPLHFQYQNEALTDAVAFAVSTSSPAAQTRFPALKNQMPIAAQVGDTLNVPLPIFPDSPAPRWWLTEDGGAELSSRGLSISSDGHLTGRLTAACPEAGCVADAVVSDSAGRAAEIQVRVTTPSTKPYDRAVAGRAATTNGVPYLGSPDATDQDCPLVSVPAEPASRALLTGLADYLDQAAGEIVNGGTELPGWALDLVPSSQQAPDLLAAAVADILKRVALQLRDASVQAAVAESMMVGVRAPASLNLNDPVSLQSFYGHYQPAVTPPTQLTTTCLTTKPSVGMRLYHYGPYNNDGWFIDWRTSPSTPARFVRLAGIDLSKYTVVPVVKPGATPRFYLLQNTDSPLVNPVSLLTFPNVPEDRCAQNPSLSGAWANIAKQVTAIPLRELINGHVPQLPAALLISAADQLLGTLPCWTIRPLILPVHAADGHQLSASFDSFATSQNGSRVALTELRTIAGAPDSGQFVVRYHVGRNGNADAGSDVFRGPLATRGSANQVALATSPSGRFLASCNAGHDPQVYDTVTDSITFPPNLPYIDPPLCVLLDLSNRGVLSFASVREVSPSRIPYIFTFRSS